MTIEELKALIDKARNLTAECQRKIFKASENKACAVGSILVAVDGVEKIASCYKKDGTINFDGYEKYNIYKRFEEIVNCSINAVIIASENDDNGREAAYAKMLEKAEKWHLEHD